MRGGRRVDECKIERCIYGWSTDGCMEGWRVEGGGVDEG